MELQIWPDIMSEWLHSYSDWWSLASIEYCVLLTSWTYWYKMDLHQCSMKTLFMSFRELLDIWDDRRIWSQKCVPHALVLSRRDGYQWDDYWIGFMTKKMFWLTLKMWILLVVQQKNGGLTCMPWRMLWIESTLPLKNSKDNSCFWMSSKII